MPTAESVKILFYQAVTVLVSLQTNSITTSIIFINNNLEEKSLTNEKPLYVYIKGLNNEKNALRLYYIVFCIK